MDGNVSLALMTLAWKSEMPSGRKFVLVSLCDNANDQGECFPSISTIAERCSMGERTVQGHVHDLIKAGILLVQERAGRSNVYTIDPRRFCAPIAADTPADSAPHPRRFRTHNHKGTINRTQREPKKGASALRWKT